LSEDGRVKRVSSSQKTSAGILAYRRDKLGLEVLLVHPGGPFGRNKDDGAWSIPKGELKASEDPEQAALREFVEELGPAASIGPLLALGEIRQRAGSASSHFAGRATSTRPCYRATRSKSSGRPEAGAVRRFRKSTARNGSISRPQGPR
jgi:predicted NUDIX family NTP pyrophosphohydrolase